MTALRATLCTSLALSVAACSGGQSEGASTTTTKAVATTTSTTALERPASTTTTAFDPATVEGEVEAAYLRSWDVYANAVYDLELDEAALSKVYADEHLQTKRDEIARRIADRQAAFVRIEHDYTVDLIHETTAIVIDRYRNHQVLIDPDTKLPTEEDPDELIVDVFTLRLASGQWKVTYLEGLQ